MEKIELTIAVMSDLHCRHGKQNQITTHLYTEAARNPKPHHPIEALKLLIKNEHLTADVLLSPGDLADRADPQGLTSGWNFVKEIATELKASFYTATVGNHDVSSRSNEENPLSYITTFMDDYPINDEFLRSLFWSNDKNFYLYESDKFVVLNFNSSYNHINEESAKSSIITDAILSKMKDELLKYANTNKIKLALCHHHPKPFPNIDEKYKDGDVIERGELFLSLLETNNFDLVLHGHKHIPRLDYYNTNLPIFCSGSFASLENIKDVSGKNTFHLINLTKSDKSSYGTIKTWEFTKGFGWLKAKSEIFFPWITGFGCKKDLSNIINDLKSMFNDSTSIIDFKNVIENIKELNQLTPKEQDKLSSSLLSEHNIEFVPILKLGPQFITKQIK